MNPDPRDQGAWQPDPWLQHPPRHELGYWLERHPGASAQPEAGSALRMMAQNLGARRGASAACLGLGLALGIDALTNLLTSDALPGALPWLVLASVLLAGLGLYHWHRVNSPTPEPSHVSTMYASTSVAGGWIMVVVFGVPLCAIAHVVLASQFDGMGRGALAYAGYQLALPAGITSVFFLPGYFSAHSRRDLRRLIAKNPACAPRSRSCRGPGSIRSEPRPSARFRPRQAIA